MSLTRKLFQITALAVIALSFTAIAATNDQTSIADRLKAAGSVCMAGEECASAGVASADTSPRSGEQIYESTCASCHTSGAAGAPVIGNAGDWSDRIAKGIDTLHDNAWNGINAMPAKGLCMNCTREELNATVDYIVENSQ